MKIELKKFSEEEVVKLDELRKDVLTHHLAQASALFTSGWEQAHKDFDEGKIDWNIYNETVSSFDIGYRAFHHSAKFRL